MDTILNFEVFQCDNGILKHTDMTINNIDNGTDIEKVQQIMAPNGNF